MEAGECGRTRRTCFIARRLEVTAVAGLLWISWCVLGAADFLIFFPSSDAHGLLQVSIRPSPHLPLLVSINSIKRSSQQDQYLEKQQAESSSSSSCRSNKQQQEPTT